MELKEDGKESSVNQYRMGRLLGEGAFGEVREAVDDKDDKYAIKCLSRSFLKKKRQFEKQGRRMKVRTALDDVQREIAIMKKVRHNNLVSLVEVIDDEENDMLFMVLEYIPGGQVMYWKNSNKTYLSKDGDLFSESQAKKMAGDILKGMSYLHTQQIIHRDLKPENILFGVDGSCKLADFGIAQKLEQEGSISRMQGTHQFMAPEMISNDKYDGFLLDVWAFGVCLHAFILGRVPFWADSVDELFTAITDDPVDLPPSVSPDLSSLLLKILEKDPQKRKSLEQLLADPWFELGDVKKPDTLEVTEQDLMEALTPIKLDFAQTVNLAIKMKKWKNNALSNAALARSEKPIAPNKYVETVEEFKKEVEESSKVEESRKVEEPSKVEFVATPKTEQITPKREGNLRRKKNSRCVIF